MFGLMRVSDHDAIVADMAEVIGNYAYLHTMDAQTIADLLERLHKLEASRARSNANLRPGNRRKAK